MNGRKFLAANAVLIGTVIIIFGFISLITFSFMEVPITETMIFFFFTISGIAFWWIGFKLNPEQNFDAGFLHRVVKH